MSTVSPSLAPDVDVDLDLAQSRLYNNDLAPVPASRRKWRVGSFAALWISMSACIPTYMLASSLIGGGMNWSQAILTIFLGNLIVVIPMILNAHAGTHYGIPFPVFCRASFGTRGANIPALMRAFVACGWFGIQTWIGGNAIYKILGGLLFRRSPTESRCPFSASPSRSSFASSFSGAINMLVVYKGIDCIRWLLEHQGAAAHRAWTCCCCGGLIKTPAASVRSFRSLPLSIPANRRAGQFFAFFVPGAHRHDRFLGDALAQHSGFFALRAFATRPDRRPGARSAADDGALRFHRRGGDVGDDDHLRTNDLGSGRCADAFHRIRSCSVIAMLALCIATLATNIAANVVSPANDFAHLAPRKISFRIGGFITGVIGILMMPWKLVADPSGYIFTWLVGYSALLGPIGGIMIADYFVYRHRQLDVDGTLSSRRPNIVTRADSASSRLIALVVADPAEHSRISRHHESLAQPTSVPHFFVALYDYAWFVGFAIAFVVLPCVAFAADLSSDAQLQDEHRIRPSFDSNSSANMNYTCKHLNCHPSIINRSPTPGHPPTKSCACARNS